MPLTEPSLPNGTNIGRTWKRAASDGFAGGPKPWGWGGKKDHCVVSADAVHVSHFLM